jgi:ORF6N domain.
MESVHIQNKIYEIRGRRVMLDFDLAQLYEVETRTLKQAVRRNAERFPDDFMFRLTKEEANILIYMGASQNVIPPDYNIGASEMFAFTEQGVAMLSAVLRSSRAVYVSIVIIRAFVALRELAQNTANIKLHALEDTEVRRLLEAFMQETEDKFDDVYVALAKLAQQQKTPRKPIGFNRESACKH